MIIRLIFALFCTFVILFLMPFLNKGRVSEEKTIISYRLHTFETKLNANMPLPEQENTMHENKAQNEAPEVVLNMPPLAMVQSRDVVDFEKMSSPVFSSSPLVLKSGSVTSLPKADMASLQAPVLGKIAIQSDGADHLLYGPKPKTPLRARQLGLNGKVVVQFEVSEMSVVENIKIISSTHEMFEKPVISAVKQYKFKQFTDESGKAIRVMLSKEFDFEIQ